MASTLNSRLVLRNDSKGNWTAVESDDISILLKGEVGIEFNPEAATENAKTKFKIGDGVHKWSELPYYEETFEKDFIFTSTFGKYVPDSSGSVTVPATGKTMTELLTDAYSTEDMEPDVTKPSITLTAGANQGYKSYEVGTSVTPSYSMSFSAGSYQYGPATGITATGYSATFNGETKTTASGTFTEFVIPDDFNKSVSAYASYSAATAGPDTNLGNEVESLKIAAGDTSSKTGSAMTSYRSYFYGTTNKALDQLTSGDIRGMTNGGNYNGAKTVEIKANGATDIKYFIVAIPSSNTRGGINKVESTAGMTVTVTDQWTKNGKTMQVADARGGENGLTNYKISYWTAATIDGATVHKVYLS